MSEDRLKQLDEDGFLKIPCFFDDGELREVQTQLARFIDQIVPALPREHVFYENRDDPATLKQIQQMWAHDDFFGELFLNGRVREFAEVLLRGKVVPKNVQYFNKPPRIGRATPPHQDGYYFMLDPCEAITMWLALDDVDEGNGGVRYIRGSHKREMRQHARTNTLGFSQGIVDFPSEEDQAEEVLMSAKPGDLLAHDALTIHHAHANNSDRNRRAIGFIYYSARAKEDKAAHSAYQKRLAEEMIEARKI